MSSGPSSSCGATAIWYSWQWWEGFKSKLVTRFNGKNRISKPLADIRRDGRALNYNDLAARQYPLRLSAA
jgi:hypothetical protein